jgi:hypothetical protein
MCGPTRIIFHKKDAYQKKRREGGILEVDASHMHMTNIMEKWKC